MDLLLYLSKYSFPHKNAIAATLAWLCKEKKLNFEVYYEASRSGEAYGGPPANEEDYFGSTIIGGRHYEQFLLLKKFFNVKYAISGGHFTFRQFIDPNEVLADTEKVSQFYRQVFSHFKTPLPSKALVIGKAHKLELDSFCYPEIYYSQALGLTSQVEELELLELRKMGLKEIMLLYLEEDEQDFFESLGFEVNVIDSIVAEEDYKRVLTRMAKRWINTAEEFMFGDPVLTSHWIPWCCRHNAISIFETHLEEILSQKSLSQKQLSKVIFGRQNSEDDILYFSKRDYCFQIVDPGRPVFPVVEKLESRIHEPETSIYDLEPSDDELERYANENMILSSILFWCPDLRHIECLCRLLDLVTVTRAKIGVGITAHWYKYAPQLLQLIYLPFERGGVFPNVEVLLCSVGLGVASEAPENLSYDTTESNLKKSKELILEKISEKSLPKGCYPFLDIEYKNASKPTLKPPFVFKFREPVNSVNERFFEALQKNGFEYVISLTSFGQPRIVFRKNDFVALNFTAGKWTGVSPYIIANNAGDFRKAEERQLKSNSPGWIISAIDSPLWLYSKPVWQKGSDLWEIIQYLMNGGKSKRLVNATPHTIARYAKILSAKNILITDSSRP